jgi:hypothetical protein
LKLILLLLVIIVFFPPWNLMVNFLHPWRSIIVVVVQFLFLFEDVDGFRLRLLLRKLL